MACPWVTLPGHNDALRDLFTTSDTAEDVDEDALDLGSRATNVSALCITSALAPPPISRKLAGLPPRARYHVQRRHDQSRAIADDTNVTIQLDICQACLFGLVFQGDWTPPARPRWHILSGGTEPLSSITILASAACTCAITVKARGLISARLASLSIKALASAVRIAPPLAMTLMGSQRVPGYRVPQMGADPNAYR